MTGKRKSRGRGLRATTGWHIHNVALASRAIDLADTLSQNDPAQPHVHAPLQILVDACDQEQISQQERHRHGLHASHASPVTARDIEPPGPTLSAYQNSDSPRSLALSPGTDNSVSSTRAAPLSWFELLARDAANADTGFLLSPLQRSPNVQAVEDKTDPRNTLRSPGLMRALLAFTARHISLESSVPGPLGTVDSVGSDDRRSSLSQTPNNLNTVDRNVAVQYYYETLRCLNKAMRHPSYASSHEVVATALLISAFEMIDGSNQDWERHLKGVFWIQRFQDNDGESGGLRQAVWWAWLRQDVWVALRERRRVFSFWQPKKPLSILSAPELATRATWLFAQCVNYASKEEQDTMELSRRLERGSELLYLLQQWYEHLPPEYGPLPGLSETQIFPPIWIHPSPYAASLQVHSLSRILVILHRPSSGGLEDYRAAQKLLTLSVNTICGIARTVDSEDSAASLISLQCVFGAGICVYTPNERLALLDLLGSHQRRLRWPRASLRKELELEYAKDEYSDYAR
ncbi:hypothetical protein PENANT_c002G07598 [Penicillium antarcticum]|uniref:Transcription factor domain-containing protein n=1 Tax=Penicillium antarcticum TaxID=416450 RepID=A0A1V6QKR7_9EURO|nr:hypothetical protein PENANT_c002G07598 [Penicillium antarcticum]